MKKIVVVLPNLVGGGAERLAIYLAHDWLERGFSVEFILMESKGDLLTLLDERVSLVDLKSKKIRKALFPLAKALRKSNPDVIWSGLWPLTSVSILSWIFAGKKGRLFTIDHNYLSISTIKQLNVPSILLKFVMRLTYPFATGVMTVSHGAKLDLENLGSFKKGRVKVIYNPAATGKPALYNVSSDESINLWGRTVKYKVITAGALSDQKNHKLLIRSFSKISQIREAKLIILGEGELRSELEDLIKSLNLEDKVKLLGFVKEPYPWFLSADLFVLSSDWEGLPTVLVESLECGLPIVSIDCPSGPYEILEKGKYGKLVPLYDELALTKAIEESLTQDHNLESLRIRAKDFSLDKISSEYLEYFGLLNARSKKNL